MRRSGRFGLFVLFLVTAWVLMFSCDAMAQKKGGGKGGQSRGKGKSGETAKDSKQKGKTKAYKPKGLSDEEMKQWEGGTPPGWSMGTKKGWEGTGAPPGKMKKGDEAKLEKAKERIRNRVREHEGKGEMERKQLEESATRSIEGAARKGVPVEHAEKTVEKGIDRGMKGEEIEKMTRAMAYGADKGTDYEELGKFMDRKMAEGERGDDLAMSVYKEIDDKHAVKQQEKMEEKLPWYKRWFKRN
ncbi:MAG: hypothetical protein KAX13_07910 [Candidatus Krumholzibacteria bacterium]|nr:hypothetical protein [Candidatus Krumholzibacteria bacterium]